jgi:choline dehydrogenase-like flavoprotein
MPKKRAEFDVCVIGTGAAGGVMIHELTAQGLNVVALERGPRLETSHFDDDELRNVVRHEIFAPHQLETYRLKPGAPSETGRFSQIGFCVGGTMTHWSGWSWRFRPDEFRVLSEDGPVAGASLADWPITYEELAPWYEKAEWDFGVAGSAGWNPFEGPRARPYPNPAHPNRAAATAFARGAVSQGYQPFPVPVAINSQPYGGRPACMYGGACRAYGCPIHAKGTTFSVSTIGTPHLLALSTSGSFPQGLANRSGQVGRNLNFHHHPHVIAVMDETMYGFTSYEAQVAIDDLHPSDASRGFIRGGVVAELNTMNHQPIAYGFAAETGPGGARWGASWKENLRTFPRSMILAGICEELPVHDNGVDPDPEVRDRFGLPVPRITHRQHENDVAMHRWYEKRLMEIAQAAGASQVWPGRLPGIYLDGSTGQKGNAHNHSTCRMGNDPESSVVDRWCRSHDVKNLWIVDGSVFPTGGGYNPTLTILANAYRVADHFVREGRRGSL